jgi:hypothetical protein
MNENIMFQYYTDNIKLSRVAGWITLNQFIRSIKTPKQHLIDMFNQIAECEARKDMEAKARLKERLYYFTPCVHINGKRQYNSITAWTGLLVLDFDHIDNAIDFKEYLFNEYDCIVCSFVSPSKKGVKAIVKIPECRSTDEFKSYYFGIGEEMQQYNGFDPSGQNCVLPLFQSWDKDILVRENATTWTIKGFYPSSLSNAPVIPAQPVETSETFEKIIIKMIDTGINNINSNGHPQLRSLCIAVGGYIANNYIQKYRALNHINHKIETNSYLKKGVSGYQTTAAWAVEVGQRKPLRLNFD